MSCQKLSNRNARTALDICKARMRRNDIDLSDVSVAVHGGEVLLEASVSQRGVRYLIEDLAAAHPAARQVDNRIKVRKRWTRA